MSPVKKGSQKKQQELIKKAKELDKKKLELMKKLRQVQIERIEIAMEASRLGLDIGTVADYCCASPESFEASQLPEEKAFDK